MLRMPNGESRRMNARLMLQQLGRSKGGTNKAAKGNRSGQFTSESGSKAARKLWRTRQRRVNGIRIGQSTKHRKLLDRKAIREAHQTPTSKLFYVAAYEQWFVDTGSSFNIPISEQTALRRLGYLKRPRKHLVPTAQEGITIVGIKRRHI